MQKITTAMLVNNVPRGSTILELSSAADARTLGLYTEPRRVVCCSAQLGEVSLLQSAANQSAVKLECVVWQGAASIAPFAGACDVVVSYNFFDTLGSSGGDESIDEALQAAHAALRPGGRLVWIEPDHDRRLGARIGSAWRSAFPKAEIFEDAEDGLDLGVAIRPSERPSGAGRPRGAPQRAGKGFAK